MALQTSNTTCDIYRTGNAPPAAPDVAGVKIYLQEDFVAAHAAATQGAGASATLYRWTHLALMSPTTDIRDEYTGGGGAGESTPVLLDTVFVPDKNGTKFVVLFVARVGRGTPADAKKVYLQRQAPTWPTDNV